MRCVLPLQCATSPCQTRQEDNRDWVRAFNRSLYQDKRFKCFYKADNLQEVLLYKLHPYSLVLHSVLWPTLIFVVGILLIWFTYCCAGCSVWTQDKTVIAWREQCQLSITKFHSKLHCKASIMLLDLRLPFCEVLMLLPILSPLDMQANSCTPKSLPSTDIHGYFYSCFVPFLYLRSEHSKKILVR